MWTRTFSLYGFIQADIIWTYFVETFQFLKINSSWWLRVCVGIRLYVCMWEQILCCAALQLMLILNDDVADTVTASTVFDCNCVRDEDVECCCFVYLWTWCYVYLIRVFLQLVFRSSCFVYFAQIELKSVFYALLFLAFYY